MAFNIVYKRIIFIKNHSSHRIFFLLFSAGLALLIHLIVVLEPVVKGCADHHRHDGDRDPDGQLHGELPHRHFVDKSQHIVGADPDDGKEHIEHGEKGDRLAKKLVPQLALHALSSALGGTSSSGALTALVRSHRLSISSLIADMSIS